MSFMACVTASGFPVSTEIAPSHHHPLLPYPFFALYIYYFHVYVEIFFLVVFICCSVCHWVVMGISFPRLGKFSSLILLTIFSVSFTRVSFPFISALLLLLGVLESLVCCVCDFFFNLIYSLTPWFNSSELSQDLTFSLFLDPVYWWGCSMNFFVSIPEILEYYFILLYFLLSFSLTKFYLHSLNCFYYFIQPCFHYLYSTIYSDPPWVS